VLSNRRRVVVADERATDRRVFGVQADELVKAELMDLG
jgi:hypothetical protein